MSKLNPYVKQQKLEEERKHQVLVKIGNLLEELVTLKAEEIKILRDQFPA